MLITYNDELNQNISEKIVKFKEHIRRQPFFLLVRPDPKIYIEDQARREFERDLKSLIDKGINNLEIPWKDEENWLDLMSNLKINFPHIHLGSASVINKKSIDDSLKLGLNFSMMRFWDKNLYLYSKKKNYLLVPGLTNLKHLKEAITLKCKIIKLFPLKDKEKSLDITKYNKISFIGAGGLSINDINKNLSLGLKAIVIGSNGYDGTKFDHKISEWLKAKKRKD